MANTYLIESIEELEKVLGTEKLNAVVTQWVSVHEIGDAGVAYPWDYRDPNPLNAQAIDDWFKAGRPGGSGSSLTDFTDWVAEQIYDSYSASGYEYDFFHPYNAALHEALAAAVKEVNPEAVVELTSVDLDELWPVGSQYVNFNLEGWHTYNLCVDILLGDYEFQNSDISTIGTLWEAWSMDRLDTISDLDEMLAHNPLSWLCEQRGLPRDAFLHEEAPAGAEDIHEEWNASWPGYQSQVVFTASMSVEEYFDALDAIAAGGSIEIGARTNGGLFDRISGGGSTLLIDNPAPLIIPADQINALAVEASGRHEDKFDGLAGDVHGYSIHETYGATKELWTESAKVTIHQPQPDKSETSESTLQRHDLNNPEPELGQGLSR